MSETGTPPAADPAPKAKNVEGYAPEYVNGLRDQLKQDQKRALEAEASLAEFRKQMADMEKVTAEKIAAAEKVAASRISEIEARAHEKLVNEALKAAATKAGIIDLDALKLLDLSSVKVNEAGEVEGHDKLMEDAKAAKAWLFRPASAGAAAPPATTASTHQPPPAPGGASHAKNATEMTRDEYRAARKGIRNGTFRVV